MGFLIFAYRKLSLRSRINNLEFKLMMLTQKEQAMTDKVSNMTQSMNSIQNYMSSNFAAQNMQRQNSIMSEAYNIDPVTKQRTLKSGYDSASINQMMVQAQYEAASQESLFKGAFEQQSKTQLASLNSQGNQMNQQKLSIESQLKLANSEYDQVEKGEDQAAKQSAPKFGLG